MSFCLDISSKAPFKGDLDATSRNHVCVGIIASFTISLINKNHIRKLLKFIDKINSIDAED
jgi:hypothetical protein